MQEHVNALTALFVALTALIPVVIKLWRTVSRANRRIESLARYRILRGTAEGLNKGLLVEQVAPDDFDPEDGFMPVAVTPEVDNAFEPVRERLKSLRKKMPNAEPSELIEAIEQQFGGWLARNVCLPLGVSDGACLIMALSIADGIMPASAPKPLANRRT